MITLPQFLVPILNRIVEKEGFVEFKTDVGSGSNIGDNFAGELLRVVVSGRQKQKNGLEIDAKLNLLCKMAPANAQRRKEFMTNVLFEREAFFYNELAPAFIRFQQEKGLPDADQFKAFPKCYEAVHDPENEIYVIIMQDLRPEGFAMWPKEKPIPTPYCRLFVRELAKFHAISFAMKDQQPDEFKEYEKFNDLIQVFIELPNKMEFFSNCYKRAIEALEDEKHKEIMKDITENIPRYMASCLGKKAADRFGVLSHGDCWNNNLLFRTNKEVRLFMPFSIERTLAFLAYYLISFYSWTPLTTYASSIGK